MLNIDIKDLLLKIAHDNDLVSFKKMGRKKKWKGGMLFPSHLKMNS
jgi:hypothetical protein